MKKDASKPVESKRSLAVVVSIAALAVFATAGMAYAAAAVFGSPFWLQIAHALWYLLTGATLVATSVRVVRDSFAGKFGVDWVALLALAGSLALAEPLAGGLISVMLLGGSALEQYAMGRARRQLAALLAEVPSQVHVEVDGDVREVALEDVHVGDVLLVRVGEVIPSDGVLLSEQAVVDMSSLTGESRPVTFSRGELLQSGGANAGSALRLEVTREPANSTYAGVIRLVEQAEAAKGKLVRLADRYALVFVATTLMIAGAAWLLTGDPLRALAVLVVATPCPLILGAPIAIVSGTSCAAKAGVLAKGGAALEALARVERILFDKTGTVTRGQPKVVDVDCTGQAQPEDVLRLCASLEQVSVHPFAAALLKAARDRELRLVMPLDSREQLGQGVEGTIEGAMIRIGQLSFVAPDAKTSPFAQSVSSRTLLEGSSSVFVSRSEVLLGAVILRDEPRPEVPRVLRMLRKEGIEHLELVTGDHRDVAAIVGEALGFDRIASERSPEQKVQVVNASRELGVTAMLGDGINDAPALALADVGIAMGARGATAASEAADVVLTRDSLLGLIAGIRIARRTGTIALQSVLVGMGASIVAMGFAAAGWIAPSAGALLQEVIDLAVMINALRALRGTEPKAHVRSKRRAAHRELSREHNALEPKVDSIAQLAKDLAGLSAEEAVQRLRELLIMLEQQLLPHEEAEQQEAYQLLADMLEDEDPTGPLVRTHQEIRRLVSRLARMLEDCRPGDLNNEQVREYQKQLYGLHAILRWHFAQEDELYALLAE